MKKMLSIVLVLAMLCGFVTVAHAASDIFEYVVLEDGTAQITGYVANVDFVTAVSIPSTIDGYTVTAIGDHAFIACVNVSVVAVPKTITSIGIGAFSGTRLNSISYGGTDAEWALVNIADENENVRNAGITYREGDYRYQIENDGTASLVGYLGSKEITVLEIPSTIAGRTVRFVSGSVGSNVFDGLDTLEAIMFPDTLEGVSCVSFAGSALKEVVFPENLFCCTSGYYDTGCFEGCVQLTNVVLSEAMIDVPSRSYADCTALKTVTMPVGCTIIGEDAFSGCTALTDVYYGGSKADWQAVYVQSGNDCLLNATIHYAGGTDVMGDVDGNDTINMRDVLALYQAVAGTSILSEAAAAVSDINGDSAVNMRDVLALYKTEFVGAA